MSLPRCCRCRRPAGAAGKEGRAAAAWARPGGGDETSEAWPWVGRGRDFEGELRLAEETVSHWWRDAPLSAQARLPHRPPLVTPKSPEGSGTAGPAVLEEKTDGTEF